MKTNAPSEYLPPAVAARISQIRAAGRRASLTEYAARIAGGFLLLAVLAMTADAAIRLFHPAARWLLSLTVLAAVAWAGLRGWHRLAARRSPAAAARDAERAVPGLEERWSTLTSMEAADDPAFRGAPGLIEKVRAEAGEWVDTVPVRTRESTNRLTRSLLWSAAGCGVLVVFSAADPGRAGVLWQRLVAPWSDASLTRVSVVSHGVDAVVARHEACELQAAVSGRTARSGTWFLERDGMVSEVPADADPQAAAPFRYVMRDPVEDFAFRFRAGDGQTAWHHVRVADRPFIQAASVTVVPPAYTGKPPEVHTGIPPRLRLLQGSGLTVRVAPGRAASRAWLQLENEAGDRLPLEKSDGAYLAVSLPAVDSVRFFPLLVSMEGLENRMPPVCEMEVVQDQPPAVTLTEDSTTEAITPADMISVGFRATDDVGIEAAEIVLTMEKKGEEPREITVPVPLGDEKGARNINRRVPLDLSKLPLEPGTEISYAVRVKDGRAVAAEAGQQAAGDVAGASGDKAADKKDNAPAVTMGSRKLDLPGCSCSGHRNLQIDGYTGESPAWREKMSVPVMTALTKIKEATAAALDLAGGVRAEMSGSRAPAAAVPAIRQAGTRTAESAAECAAFLTLTEGTPYAMIGLDIGNLRTREILPARDALSEAPGAEEAVKPMNVAVMHLRTALAWLERILARTEEIAKEEAAAALAQKIKEMHRIFLEDSLALLELAQGKGAAVPELPMIEVSRRYAELLEKRKQAMAALMKELAALLAGNPDMMERYLINRSQGADAFQVQVDNLVRDQDSLNRQTRKLSDAGGVESAAAAAVFQPAVNAQQARVADDFGSLLRSATAFFPKQIPRDAPEVVAFSDALLAAASLPLDDNAGRQKALRTVLHSLSAIADLNGGASWAARQRKVLTDLSLRQEWLLEMAAAVTAGHTARAAGLMQRDLERRTRILGAKIETQLEPMASFSPALKPVAAAINAAFSRTTVPAQQSAAGFLQNGTWAPAGPPQEKALTGLQAVAGGCRELVNLIAEEMKKYPPQPQDPDGPPTSLESLIQELVEDQMSAAEGFSLPEWKLNIELISDWVTDCKGAAGAKPGEKPGDQPGKNPGDQPDPASTEAMKAAAEQSQQLAAAAARVQQAANAKAKALAEAGATEPGAGTDHTAAAARKSRDGWNKLPSELGKDIRQEQDAPPPEEYRHAVETYFRRIGAAAAGQ